MMTCSRVMPAITLPSLIAERTYLGIAVDLRPGIGLHDQLRDELLQGLFLAPVVLADAHRFPVDLHGCPVARVVGEHLDRSAGRNHRQLSPIGVADPVLVVVEIAAGVAPDELLCACEG